MEPSSSNQLDLFKVTDETLKNYGKKNMKKKQYFSKPRLVAYFEYNYGKITNAKRINYFRNLQPDQYPIDLKIGVDSYIRCEPVMYSRKFEATLKYVMSLAAENESNDDGIKTTKIITNRNTLMHIMESYYNDVDKGLYIRVSRYDGNLYLVMDRPDTSCDELQATQTHHQVFSQLLFTDAPYNKPEINKPIDRNIVLIGVYRVNFGNYDIIYSGEIEGIKSNEEITNFDNMDVLNDCHFVSTKQLWNDKEQYGNVYLKIWLNSLLANVEEIYIGFKDKEAIIKEAIERYELNDLPMDMFWKPWVCKGVLYDLLMNIENKMSSVNCLNTVYVVHYNRKEKCFTYKIFSDKNEKSFITEEYMAFCCSRNNANNMDN